MARPCYLSVRLSEEDIRRYILVLLKFLPEYAYPTVNASKSEQFRMLLEKLPKADRMPPFCDGRSLSEHYLKKWKRKE